MAYDEAFYDDQGEGKLASAKVVLPILLKCYKPNSIIDVGCGLGTWLKAATECGVEDLLGIYGAHVDRKALLDQCHFQVIDLVQKFEVPRRFDLAISLEVGEHLPFYRAETFVADLVRLSDVVLLPYQGGTEHINEQWLEWLAICFRRHGYLPCELFRDGLWGDKRVEFWYSQNPIIFCKQEMARAPFPAEFIAAARPLSFPHPLAFAVNVSRYRPLSGQALEMELDDCHYLLAAYLAGGTRLPLLKLWE